eukprot:5315748-Amphidinium_carterae.2
MLRPNDGEGGREEAEFLKVCLLAQVEVYVYQIWYCKNILQFALYWDQLWLGPLKHALGLTVCCACGWYAVTWSHLKMCQKLAVVHLCARDSMAEPSEREQPCFMPSDKNELPALLSLLIWAK